MTNQILGQYSAGVQPASEHSTLLTCYLPNPPKLPAGIDNYQQLCQLTDCVDLLIQTNGNHWRKILVILAKLGAGLELKRMPSEKEWKHFRDHKLLITAAINISFEHSLAKHDGIHLIASQQHWPHFINAHNLNAAETLSTHKKAIVLHQDKQLPCYFISDEKKLFAPYLDYRQFPNRLIEQCLAQICSLPAPK